MDGSAQISTDTIKARGVALPLSAAIPGRIRGALKRGEYDAPLARAALDTGQAGDIVVDLGAGLGFTSALMTRRGKAAEVHAFEPQTELADIIREVHRLNNVTGSVTEATLGKRKGKADLHVGSHLLRASLAFDPGQETCPQSIDVLNAKTTLKSLKASLLICDIGGAEAAVLPDLDLSALRAVIVRLHPKLIGADGVREVFSCAQEAGLAYNPGASNGKIVSFVRDWPTA
ncbi:MAG: FkbM family methyltransferase [Pseudomonadota bacterium]